MIFSSASVGIPGRPHLREQAPSCITPPLRSITLSCAWSMIGRFAARARRMASSISASSCTVEPSSVNAAAPAAFSAARSFTAWPLRSRVMAPDGSTRTKPASAPRLLTNATRSGVS